MEESGRLQSEGSKESDATEHTQRELFPLKLKPASASSSSESSWPHGRLPLVIALSHTDTKHPAVYETVTLRLG